MTGLLANGFTKHPRFCLDCSHIHGIFAYGLCMELVDGEICPCTELRAVRRRGNRKEGPVCARTLMRRAARMFEEMSPAERAKLERWVRRWLDSGLELHEFAAEVGVDRKLLWRTWRSLPGASARKSGGGVTRCRR